MKNITKKVLMMTLFMGSLAITACNGGGNSKKPTTSRPPVVRSSTPEAESSVPPAQAPKYEVKVLGADGAEISKQTMDFGAKLTKPADPTTPAGKVFYGWMNTKNGNQIWDFDADDINVVMQDIELKPLFVDEGKMQVFEAELCPDITERIGKNGTAGMDGATYSGGAQGRQLISKAYDGEFKASGAYKITDWDQESATYGKADYASEADVADPDIDVFGGYVHFMYEKGDTLTWELESDADATNVTLFMRLSAEYGVKDPVTEEIYSWIDGTTFPIKVNDVAVPYNKITLHNITEKTFLTYQDYYVSATVSLKAGANKIQMIVDNEVTLNGTIASSAPCVDCIKLLSSSNITWPKAKISQMDLGDD